MATYKELLDDSIQAMADLHDSMTLDEKCENAIVSPIAFMKFIRAHTRLVFERERATHYPLEQILKG